MITLDRLQQVKDYLYFKNYYKLIAIDLSKQQKLYGPKAIQ